ncbi:hypothetical protein [Arthrobacter sp. EPSL27]|uniref:hypothetical protein n=1 Tax=Arthrobacter sp. EPSL27 TaxID=1745378 RepID=UPI000A9B5B97|nr:hypothetical protein [Arthrobacter sp. EPSL27]
MKRRGLLLIALGGCAALVSLALLFGETLPGSKVCPAVGYGFDGHVELIFSQEPASVAACFGEGCTPEPVVKSDVGRWLVPQSRPYLVPPVNVTSINVEVVALSGARNGGELQIETESTGEYPFGKECGGPFRFKPVRVPFS